MCPNDFISCTTVSEFEYNFHRNLLIRRHLLSKDSIEHSFIGEIGFTIETPEKRLRKCGFSCAVFANNESNISLGVGGEIYLFVDELPKVLQFY